MSTSTSSVAGTRFNHVPPDVSGIAPSVVSLGDQLTYCPIVVAVSGEADGAPAGRDVSYVPPFECNGEAQPVPADA